MAEPWNDPVCPSCGQAFPPGITACPNCDVSIQVAIGRETTLLLTLPILLAFLAVTGFAARRFHARQQALAEVWSKRGQADLRRGHVNEAVEDFRTALVYWRGNDEDQLRLGQAFLAANRTEEARTYLVRLWDTNPASGNVNLELARLAAQEGDLTAAVSYFHSALDGVWNPSSAESRRAMRLELCNLLLEKGPRAEALAELTALSSETPDDPKLRTEVASLFLRGSYFRPALGEYLRSLRLDRHQPQAWRGAGEAAFRLGEYSLARQYLSRALSGHLKDAEAEQMFETAGWVLEMDPFAPSLTDRERRGRVIEAFRIGFERFEACAQSQRIGFESSGPPTNLETALATASDWKKKVRESELRRNPDLMEKTMDQVYQIEKLAAQKCGEPASKDRALLLLAGRNGGLEE